jgi:hypothetical protein
MPSRRRSYPGSGTTSRRWVRLGTTKPRHRGVLPAFTGVPVVPVHWVPPGYDLQGWVTSAPPAPTPPTGVGQVRPRLAANLPAAIPLAQPAQGRRRVMLGPRLTSSHSRPSRRSISSNSTTGGNTMITRRTALAAYLLIQGLIAVWGFHLIPPI